MITELQSQKTRGGGYLEAHPRSLYKQMFKERFYKYPWNWTESSVHVLKY